MTRTTATSSDGRWTVVDEVTLVGDVSGDPDERQSTYLVDNQSGTRTSLYSYTGHDTAYDVRLFFSPDSRFAIYEARDPALTGVSYNPTRFYAVDTLTKEVYLVTGQNPFYRDVRVSSDGSKVLWITKNDMGQVTDAFYFPHIAQFSYPKIAGEKVDQYGKGALVVGDSVEITLDLKGVAKSIDPQKITLTLNTGATIAYDAAKSRPGEAYVFTYTVKSDDFIADLAIKSVNLNGAKLTGADGKDIFVASDISDFRGTLKVNGYIGSSADENFLGTAGAEAFQGLAGDDIYRINNKDDRVVEARGEGHDTVVATIDFKLAAGQEIEVIRVARSEWSADIDLTGNEFDQTLEGNLGDNILDGGGGADSMRGFLGDDTFIVDTARDQVIEGIDRGNDTVLALTSYRLAAGQEIETLRLMASTGSQNLNLTGNEFAQALIGNDGNNTFDGGGGADVMTGGRGNDIYAVDNAGDRVIEAAGGGADRVFATASYALAAGQEVEALQLLASTGTARLDLSGNEFAQTLVGNAGANILDGKGGADTMVGGAGGDTYVVDNAGDIVREARGGGTDTVVASVTYRLAAGQEVEAVSGSAGQRNLDLTGNEFGQTLTGNDGANVLDGGAGADVLTGGRGQDAFLFSTALSTGNVDRITDFAPVDDTIRLSEDVFGALDAGPLAARAFKNISADTIDADDRILYEQTTGELFYDADGSGKGAAVRFAVLDNQAKLTHDDFFVV